MHADQILKRLGDSYVETRLIQDQIFDLTGLRYVAGARDDRSLMQALYDNAVDAHQNLSLTIGIALTPSQIAALGGDIIWLERHTIEGQEVLVPRLYLASSTLENLDFSSARIAGSTTIINAAHVYNSGTISGTDALAIQTSGDLENVGGSLLSDGNIGIRAGGLFANQSGIVAAGGNVGIAAGGILNQTIESRDEFDGGSPTACTGWSACRPRRATSPCLPSRARYRCSATATNPASATPTRRGPAVVHGGGPGPRRDDHRARRDRAGRRAEHRRRQGRGGRVRGWRRHPR